MPKQKDLKRIVRARMERTGESYTAARLHIVRKQDVDFSKLAGMSDEKVEQATGRSWAAWVKVLDEAGSMSKPHRDIARYLHSLGTSDWWSQMVTVGYERIRGLREKGQQRGGGYSAGKSKTFNVPVKKLFDAFLRELPPNAALKSKTANKRARLAFDDGTSAEAMFLSKSATKSTVAVTHQKLPDRAAVEKMKALWSAHLAALSEMLA